MFTKLREMNVNETSVLILDLDRSRRTLHAPLAISCSSPLEREGESLHSCVVTSRISSVVNTGYYLVIDHSSRVYQASDLKPERLNEVARCGLHQTI